MRKFAVILTSAVLAFSAVGCQAWGSSASCCTTKGCCKSSKCNKCCKHNNHNCKCSSKKGR